MRTAPGPSGADPPLEKERSHNRPRGDETVSFLCARARVPFEFVRTRRPKTRSEKKRLHGREGVSMIKHAAMDHSGPIGPIGARSFTSKDSTRSQLSRENLTLEPRISPFRRKRPSQRPLSTTTPSNGRGASVACRNINKQV